MRSNRSRRTKDRRCKGDRLLGRRQLAQEVEIAGLSPRTSRKEGPLVYNGRRHRRRKQGRSLTGGAVRTVAGSWRSERLRGRVLSVRLVGGGLLRRRGVTDRRCVRRQVHHAVSTTGAGR